MSSRKAAAAIAALLFVVGLAIALWPVSVTDDVACGSALQPSSTAEAATLVAKATEGPAAVDYAAECGDAIEARRWIAVPLVGVGALAGLFLVLTNNVREGESASSRSRTGSQ